MSYEIVVKSRKFVREFFAFFFPKKGIKKILTHVSNKKRITIIIPTFKPKYITYRLINNVSTWDKNIQIIVVDDNTPKGASQSINILEKIKELTQNNKKIILLQTDKTHLKANALNFALNYISKQKSKPDVVLTFDDDVTINHNTIQILVDVIFQDDKTGAVVSNAWVKNRKKNLLTRLQSLEYHGFNITKISDTGFLSGPLVMQGMLSAFRYKALLDVKGYKTDKLIEDYDITVRIKKAGWKTAIAPSAHAWTNVPETLPELWKQRVRWSYGGIIVVKDFWRDYSHVLQDIIGHTLFLSLLIVVLLSLVIVRNHETPPALVFGIFVIAILHFTLSYTFNLVSLLSFKERDKWDWIIKALIIPEFIYSNILSAILIGSYLFFIFNTLSKFAIKYSPKLIAAEQAGHRAFQKIGYTLSWGTRA
ncbi:MAG: glycosyltransferase family 2 protein [Candidatus Levybacteria bacterium]|nr:glycosyltransferase family 2 protein [Candidatus Levybacteria bacterium]MBP9815443.1 glycosyltransferase family 2 protein [Candidatus Levybacteria bacterium]